MNPVYGYVTENIIKQLENGVVPWQKPWMAKGMINYITRKPYQGINLLLLDKPGEYLSFKQVQALGGKVKKNAKSKMIVYYKNLNKTENEGTDNEVEDEENTKAPKFVLRYYNVFHLDDCEGIESKLESFENENNELADEVMQNYVNAPVIQFESGQAYYRPSADLISVPPLEDYKNPDEFYSTLYHEAVHSTGSPKRLNRKGISEMARFGDEKYSFEELVAEIGAAMLCSHVNIESSFDNSVAYIGSWIKKLKDDKTLIVKASGDAQKAVKHILGIE